MKGIEFPCKREVDRLAASNGVILVVVVSLCVLWAFLYVHASKEKRRVENQTMIIKSMESAGNSIIVLDKDGKIIYQDRKDNFEIGKAVTGKQDE